jgi:cyclase
MSLARRIIPCLDTDGTRVVKGVNFLGLRDAGDPATLAARYNAEGADELVVLDIAASRDCRPTFLETIRRVAAELTIPLAAGGGIRSLDEARGVIRAGADKITINTAAVQRPALITELSKEFGAQAVVVAIDAKLNSAPLGSSVVDPSSTAAPGCAAVGDSARFSSSESNRQTRRRWDVRIRGGRDSAHLDAEAWAQRAVELGAGEILLTSMDRDGTQSGFDIALTNTISTAISVPVIASGGAKSPQHFAEVFSVGAADAALAASIFHDDTQSIRALKQFLASRNIEVRVPC